MVSKKHHFFRATSAASPIVAGVVAVIRQANPNLGWRDVKLILAESATKNDPNHRGWQQGHHKKSGGSFHFNHRYGFGLVNAEKAIALTKSWNHLPPMKTKMFEKQTST